MKIVERATAYHAFASSKRALPFGRVGMASHNCRERDKVIFLTGKLKKMLEVRFRCTGFEMATILFSCKTSPAFDGRAIETSPLGGIESATSDLAMTFAERGHTVFVATRTETPLLYKGVNWVPLAAIAHLSADIVISNNDATVFDVFAKAKKAHCQRVVWLHNPVQVEKAIRKRQFFKIIKHRPDVVFVGSHLRRITSSLLMFRNRYVIPHGLTSAFLTTPPQDPLPHIIWLSQPQRGLRETLHIWRKLIQPWVPEAKFQIFGVSRSFVELNDAELIASNIVLHGHVKKSELARHMANCRAMLYPGARDETFCLAAAEAQAMGVPVITRGIGALQERVTHGVNGLIYTSSKDAAQATVRVLTDDILWRTLREGALRNRDTLTWQAAARQWEQFFELVPTMPNSTETSNMLQSL